MPIFSDEAKPCEVRDNETKKSDFASGLTKREQAAIQILAGLVANQFNCNDRHESLANRAVDLADKLFDRLEK